MNDERMIKGYFVQVPPTLAEVLADIGGKSADADFDEIVNAAFASFFSFYTPRLISNTLAVDLEKFVLNYFILRRVGSGNIRKWRQIFRNEWSRIIPYYERLLETQENESNYFENPIRNVDMKHGEEAEGTRNTDTDRDRTTGLTHTGTGTHTTDETNSKTHSGTFSENTSSTEINRYSDTPQGDSSDIWETDAQGHAVLSDIYLTDIRGITDSGTRSGTDSYTESGTIDRDEATSDQYTDAGTENETTDVDETTTSTKTSDEIGYSGKSPVELLQTYRESFLNIYTDIVNELDHVFYSLVEVDDLVDFV